jgi:hypothetical protein
VIIHVLDARDPLGTRCRNVEKYLREEAPHKHLVFVLNKCDLVPTSVAVRFLFPFRLPQHPNALKSGCLPHILLPMEEIRYVIGRSNIQSRYSCVFGPGVDRVSSWGSVMSMALFHLELKSYLHPCRVAHGSLLSIDSYIPTVKFLFVSCGQTMLTSYRLLGCGICPKNIRL